MNMRLIKQSSAFLSFFITAALGFSATGPLVRITGTGGQPAFNVNVWLNGLGPLSGQSFTVTGGNALTITPTVPGHTYPAMGIEVTTAGYSFNAGCSQIVGNRCIFSASKGAPANVTVTGEPQPQQSCVDNTCKVFVSATTFNTGNIASGGINSQGVDMSMCPTDQGALVRANCICNLDANKPIGAGQYYSWLSTNVKDARDNIKYSDLFQYVRTSEAVIANPGQLLTGSLQAAIDSDSVYIWTGTGSNGSIDASDRTCQNFTSADSSNDSIFGDSEKINHGWTSLEETGGLAALCNSNDFRVYCFEGPTS